MIIKMVCRICSAIEEEQDDDFQGEEPRDDDTTIPPDLDSNTEATVRSILCNLCFEALESRFDRPTHSLGRDTLGDTLIRVFDAQLRGLEEDMDPDLREVFPTLSDEFRPARRRLARIGSNLRAALDRVGRPVCIFRREWDEDLSEIDQEPAFIMFRPSGSTSYGYNEYDYFEVAEEHDFVNGFNYAPDGNLLSGE